MDGDFIEFGYSWFLSGFGIGALLSAIPFMISYAIKAIVKVFKM